MNWALVIYIEINRELQNFAIQAVYALCIYIYFGNILYLLLQIFTLDLISWFYMNIGLYIKQLYLLQSFHY